MKTAIKIISLVAILSIGYIIYNFFYPIKFVEKDKLKTKFIKIDNPFGDANYYLVEKYLYSKKEMSFGFGGGKSYVQDYYGSGLANATKKIMIVPTENNNISFTKAVGYNKNQQLDTVNLIKSSIIKNSIKTITFYKPNGLPFNYKNRFLNDIVILPSGKKLGYLFDFKTNTYRTGISELRFLNPDKIMIRTVKLNDSLKKYTKFFGVISAKGDTIVPINKSSEKEALALMKK